jgi:dolichol-phosphate mannosyltransferase
VNPLIEAQQASARTYQQPSRHTATTSMKIAVAIPCYKVTQHVLGVIRDIGPEVEKIYAVDDACPAGSGRFIEENNTDTRVRVLYNPEN